MWASILALIQIIAMLLKWWFEQDAEKKAKISALKEEIKNAKTTADITRLFDDINAL